MADYWAGMECDPESIDRIRLSCGLLDARVGMTVLDIGCYKQLARKFLPSCRYVGFDFDNFCEGTIVRDLESGFLWDEPVDRILCLEVLEHLKTPSRTLNSIHYYLKKDGIAVISLPNESTLFHRIRSLLGTVDAECFGERGKHLHLPSLSQCRAFLRRSGFVIVREKYYLAFGSSRQKWLTASLRLLPKRWMQFLADLLPSLFARGFVFVLKKQ